MHAKTKVTSEELKKFGLLMGFIIPLLFGLLFPWIFSSIFPLWPWLLGAGFWVLALLRPELLDVVFKIWMRVGAILGWLNSRIILIFLFYIVMFPIGLTLRLFRNDPLHRKFESKLTSYRVSSNSRPKSSMENPF